VNESLIGLVKERVWALLVRLSSLRKPSIRYCIDNNLLPTLLTKIPGNTLRAILALPPSDHQTQLNQDIFALLMNKFRPGFFLEIGANDGFTLSNTVYLEKEFGWKGVLVEANPKYMGSLSGRTKSVIVNRAVSAQEGEAAFIDAGLYGGLESSLDSSHSQYTDGAARITVECIELQELLDMTAAPSRIDFISIDVEGGEVPIVEQMMASTRRFGCGCIEFNGRRTDYSRMVSLLEGAGYRLVWENQTDHDLFFVDSEMHVPLENANNAAL
jgi:FkbM family methyltransferase